MTPPARFRIGKSAKAFRAFVRAPAATKATALEAAAALLLARLLVKHVPMRRWRRGLVLVEPPGPDAPKRRLSRRTAYVMRRIARHAPFSAICLPQAMALQWMLRRRGVASRLIFGARRKAEGAELDFHAWLTVGGKCVIGGGEIETFAALPPVGDVEPQPGRTIRCE